MKIGPYELTRGALAPYKTKRQRVGKVQEAEDGSVTAVQKPFSRRFIRFKARLPVAEAKAVANYLENGVKFAGEIFAIVDGDGISWNVRFWGSAFDVIEERGSSLASVDFIFRVEVGQY